MLSIFANAMNIATRTETNPSERHNRAQEDLKRYDLGIYKRWAEAEGRYLVKAAQFGGR